MATEKITLRFLRNLIARDVVTGYPPLTPVHYPSPDSEKTAELNHILKLITRLPSEWEQSRIFTGIVRTAEASKNVRVFADSRTKGLALLMLLYIILDEHDIYRECIARARDVHANNKELALHHGLDRGAPRIVLLFAAEAASDMLVAFDDIIVDGDLWTLNRIRAALRPPPAPSPDPRRVGNAPLRPLTKTPPRILKAMDETM